MLAARHDDDDDFYLKLSIRTYLEIERGLVRFYNKSSLIGYLMTNPVYT